MSERKIKSTISKLENDLRKLSKTDQVIAYDALYNLLEKTEEDLCKLRILSALNPELIVRGTIPCDEADSL
jgi:hypothetical protein